MPTAAGVHPAAVACLRRVDCAVRFGRARFRRRRGRRLGRLAVRPRLHQAVGAFGELLESRVPHRHDAAHHGRRVAATRGSRAGGIRAFLHAVHIGFHGVAEGGIGLHDDLQNLLLIFHRALWAVAEERVLQGRDALRIARRRQRLGEFELLLEVFLRGVEDQLFGFFHRLEHGLGDFLRGFDLAVVQGHACLRNCLHVETPGWMTKRQPACSVIPAIAAEIHGQAQNCKLPARSTNAMDES